MMKPFHPGHGAMSGFLAVEMAAGGFTAASDAIGGDIGFLKAYGNSIDMEPLIALGRPWAYDLLGMWIKPYPSGNLTHPGMSRIDEFLKKMRQTVTKYVSQKSKLNSQFTTLLFITILKLDCKVNFLWSFASSKYSLTEAWSKRFFRRSCSTRRYSKYAW